MPPRYSTLCRHLLSGPAKTEKIIMNVKTNDWLADNDVARDGAGRRNGFGQLPGVGFTFRTFD